MFWLEHKKLPGLSGKNVLRTVCAIAINVKAGDVFPKRIQAFGIIGIVKAVFIKKSLGVVPIVT